MSDLKNTPNIGKVLEEKLRQVNINTREELIALGSREAFKKLRLQDNSVCLNTLLALEGAIHDARWHNLDEKHKKDLKEFFDSLK